MNIKGGTFHDTSWIKPAGHIWAKSKQVWVTFPAGDIIYQAQPDNYDLLTRAYAQDMN